MKKLLVCALAVLQLHSLSREDYFTPKHRLTAIGASRPDLDALTLAARTGRANDGGAETFTTTFSRDPPPPHALAGAQRIASPHLQQIFRQASAQTGFPASTLAAIAYLESFGDPLAESPAGPKGIMQFSEATARSAGLSIVRALPAIALLLKRPSSTVAPAKKPIYKTVQRKDSRTPPFFRCAARRCCLIV